MRLKVTIRTFDHITTTPQEFEYRFPSNYYKAFRKFLAKAAAESIAFVDMEKGPVKIEIEIVQEET